MAMIEYLTDAGREMLSQMIAGKKPISYTKIQMGDGVITTSYDKRTMTSLINPIVTLDVESVSVTTENVIKITGVFSNESLTSGFYYREKAIFASDGENEILFSYANAGSESEWIEPPTVEIIEKKIMSLYKEFQDTETDLKIQIKSGIYVSTDDFNAALNELEGKYAKKDLYDDTTINVGRKAGTEIGSNSTSEGNSTTASGASSHAEGSETIAAGYCSHSEGEGTNAGDDYAHVEGLNTYAGYCSHAEGEGSNADSACQHVEGKYNISDLSHKYAHIIGNGNSDRERSNAHTVDWEGNAWYAGDVFNGNGVSLDGLNTNISDAWNSSVTYGVNSYCIYNNKLWKCKVQHTNQPPTEGTYWTACTISGEISELNSNLGKFEESSDSIKTVPNNTSTIVSSKTLHAGTYILKGVVRFPNATSDYLRSIGFDTRSSLQYPICSYKDAESIISKDTITLNVIKIIQIAADTTYNLYAYQNSGLSQDTSYNTISVIRIK